MRGACLAHDARLVTGASGMRVAHEHIAFGYHFARPTKTAFEAIPTPRCVPRFCAPAITLLRCSIFQRATVADISRYRRAGIRRADGFCGLAGSDIGGAGILSIRATISVASAEY